MCCSQWEITCRVSGTTASLLINHLLPSPYACIALSTVESQHLSSSLHSTRMQKGKTKRHAALSALQLQLESKLKLKRPPTEGQKKGGEGFMSEQEVTLPAALHIPFAGSWPVVPASALRGALHPSGTNVTSGVPKPPRRGRRGACVVPWAPGLRSDGGLVRHQAGHRGQGSLTLMVLLLRSCNGQGKGQRTGAVQRRHCFSAPLRGGRGRMTSTLFFFSPAS